MNLTYERFADIHLNDPFFDSLKQDYEEFAEWFARKAEEKAYVMRDSSGELFAFLYLKIETEAVEDIHPPLEAKKRIKVGTLKINAHGSRLGERFVKKIFDHALSAEVDEIYVTVFDKHAGLISLFQKYGFVEHGQKATPNGTELVLLKSLHERHADLVANYPIIRTQDANIYLLALQPQWHTRLLPDSILKSEDTSILEDVSYSNSIHKVYLANMRNLPVLKTGDVILIYRTSDGMGPAEYRSVATSLCVVEEFRNISSFANETEFMTYCRPYSVFNETELAEFWKTKKYPHVIRFTYNFALPKRLTRTSLISDHGLRRDDYWGFMKLSHNQFHSILSASKFDESLVIH